MYPVGEDLTRVVRFYLPKQEGGEGGSIVAFAYPAGVPNGPTPHI